MADQQPIWFRKDLSIHDVKELGTIYMSTFLGMEWEQLTGNSLSMSMPVNDKTKQPYGLLHGGASCALAETVGSVASFLVIDSSKYMCVGQEINASHLKSALDGRVLATAVPLRLGKTAHVWDIKITNEADELVCVCRLTVAIRPIRVS